MTRLTSPSWHVPAPADSSEGTYCARGDFCSGFSLKPSPSGPVRCPAITPGGLCDACATLIGVQVGELPDAFTRLRRELGEPHSRRRNDVRSVLGPALPLRTDIDALLRLMALTLWGWEARVRHSPRLNLSAMPEGRLGTPAQVERSAAILTTHLSALLALPKARMIRPVPMSVKERQDHHAPLIPETLEESWGDWEIRYVGVDSLVLWVWLDGTAAGLELLDLHHRARAVLGETRPPRETLDGIPCQHCEAMSLERAEPPSDPEKAAPYSVCADCGATMDEGHYQQWAAWYSGWAKGIERACVRCAKGDHAACEWRGCLCRGESPHAHGRLMAA